MRLSKSTAHVSTAGPAYAAVMAEAETAVATIAAFLAEHKAMPGQHYWGHVGYIEEITRKLAAIVQDIEA